MTEMRNLSDIEAKLAEYVPLVREVTGKDITLDRMLPLMAAVGNPESKLRVIHVAGTSGKTSTTYYIAALLIAAGKKVGLTVSPHIDSVAERVQIDLEPLGEVEFSQALTEFLSIINEAQVKPTYFELLVAFAYWYFDKAGVDYAVIETGMGGLHDGTNVAERKDKVCVITDIGFDHMNVLGNTLQEIAAQKAGIIHLHNQTFMYRQSEEIVQVIKRQCLEKSALLEVFNDQETSEFRDESTYRLLPDFQKRNWGLAYEVFKYIKKRDSLNGLSANQLVDTMYTAVPGRMDTVAVSDKTIIMDGAHNGQKMEAFVKSFQTRYVNQKAAVVLGLKQDKHFGEVLETLQPITSTLILTSFETSQDLPAVGIETSVLEVAARETGFTDIINEPDFRKAYKLLESCHDELAIITGSFYLIGQMRHEFEELTRAQG